MFFFVHVNGISKWVCIILAFCPKVANVSPYFMASPCSLCFLLVREDDILSSNSGTVLQWGSHQHHLLTPAHTKYIAHFNFYHTQLNFIETFGNSILKHWSISLHPTLLKAWYLLMMWLDLRNLCYKTKYLNTPSAKTSILKLKRVFYNIWRIWIVFIHSSLVCYDLQNVLHFVL